LIFVSSTRYVQKSSIIEFQSEMLPIYSSRGH
jgi:hypothetical protein